MASRTTRRRWLSRRGDHGEDRTLTAQSVPPACLQGATSGPYPPPTSPVNALAIGDVWACVRVLADAAASLPLIAYRRTTTGRVRYSGRVVDLLDRPSPATTQANLVAQMVGHLALYGNAYIGKVKDGDGVVTSLVLLSPDRIVPQIKAGEPLYTYTPVYGAQTVLTGGDVIHVRTLSTDGLMGLSPIRQCRTALGLATGLGQHAYSFFQNDARPSGILKVQSPGSDAESLRDLKTAWEGRHSGAGNAHRIAVVSGEVAFTPISVPLDDVEFVEQRRLSTAEIARIFRVPPWMIGASSDDSMTYSNVEQQALSFVTYSLRPYLVVIEQAITNDPDLSPQTVYSEFLIDAVLRSDAATRAAIWTQALDPATGWMTKAEVRERENLDPNVDLQEVNQ